MVSKIRFPGGKNKVLVMSFDDGCITDVRLAELFRKNGIKGTFNINSGAAFTSEETKNEDRDMAWSKLKISELKYIHDMGHEIAVHGLTHASLWRVTPTEAINEIIEDRKNLERILGTVVRGMAYPNGGDNEKVFDILKSCGICYSRTTEAKESLTKTFPPKNWLAMPTTCKYDNPKLMEFAKTFAERPPYNYEEYFLLYVWGHSWELEAHNHWGIMEDFAKLAGNRDDVWYATNIELYDYVKAFEALHKSAEGDLVYNPTNTKLWLQACGKVITIDPGETVDLKNI